MDSQRLYQQLLQLDQRSYKAYKQIAGVYQFPGFQLSIDYVQGDPFASPSRLRVQIPQTGSQETDSGIQSFPEELYRSHSREVALRDYLTRQFAQVAAEVRGRRGSGNSGLIAIAPTSQQVLERTSVLITSKQLEARFVVGLPARGRTILGKQAAELLCEDLPLIVDRALNYAQLNFAELRHHVETVEDADWLRQKLAERGLVAFVANGAILPRQSGVDDRPLTQNALPFESPASLQVNFQRPNQGEISGMGIPSGITLIVGGGYHGKSTLLKAIALGIYNHIPGDGREFVVTNPAAVKIRAEDGRSIAGVNISPFINHLPQGRSTEQFSTENASGSTSQAANIMEALEAGATVLLVDEDTSATNFMIRDRRMQALIAKSKEPITPFVDKIRQLYQDYSVSTILVMGGSGDYFDVADTVIAMTDFQPQEVTAQAKAIAQQYATDRTPEGGSQFGAIAQRIPHFSLPQERGERPPRTKVRDVDELVFGAEAIDLTAVEQIVEVNQLRAIGAALTYIQQHYLDGQYSLKTILEYVMADLQSSSPDVLTAFPQGDLAMFRPDELAAVLNRMRSLNTTSQPKAHPLA
ncbi:ABC-ATPase domain-containing protein [Leptolyngbya sp. FACHB-671]|uniref:ABC-ATPase domain-containing protein n=1 Tax=Leptolyngbya sp. FACHB-671 TaxID=2692812 RepID=UPI001685CDDB|nr:ABC-ATPase domain-containing protein [Leptolyngbya sp. FACHB-671]MBD2068423.1 ABC-ATPase domain-containing protein [Leptolyngbya sp. FACHB-671]